MTQNNDTRLGHFTGCKKISEQGVLFEQIKEGAIVVTPNNRLSNQLLDDFFHRGNQAVYDKPMCMPYQAFLQRLFQNVRHAYPHQSHPMVLSSFQESILWKEVLKSEDDYPLSEGLIQEVQNAWASSLHWQLDTTDSIFHHTPHTEQFQHWQENFQARLEKLDAITSEQLVNYICKFPEALSYKTIIWACFNELTPQQIFLQERLITAECEQIEYDLDSPPESFCQYPAKDTQDELIQMAQWVKDRLKKGDTRIGVVIPELQTNARMLQRFIKRHFTDDHFNLSLGEPLANYPLIAHALTFLRLNKNELFNQEARLLLTTPYIKGSASEFHQRSQLLQDSKLLQELRLPFLLWVDEINQKAPILSEALRKLQEYPAKASASDWAAFFKNRLQSLGFPGEYQLNSANFQCLQRFKLLLDEFLELGTICKELSAEKALDCFDYLAKSTIFQLKKSKTPVIISGLLEAAGCQFDSIWVSGMGDQCLPQKVRLSPFIPIELQRTLSMPRALPEKELQFANALVNRLKNGCHHIVFSYPRLINDIPNLPSPLIRLMPKFEPFPCSSSSSTHLQAFDEAYSVPVFPDEKLSGGTALLGNQAKCPFRAFATHRLHAKKTAMISAGPDASERGQVIHGIMEKFWQEVGSQRQLLAMTPNNIDGLITKAIHEALTPTIKLRCFSFPQAMQEVEHSRLKKLALACLEWERSRPEFEVEAVEKTFLLHLAGIDFRIRIDRLDKVGNSKWVIDYKSTLPVNKPWDSDRPEEPQLLLYALLDEEINSLLFLQLKAGKALCSGLSEEESELQGLKGLKKEENWADLRAVWQQQLQGLAEEFRTGYCPPNPIRSSLCQQCDFPSLCRM